MIETPFHLLLRFSLLFRYQDFKNLYKLSAADLSKLSNAPIKGVHENSGFFSLPIQEIIKLPG